jgi:hypothetical protein
MIPPITYYTEKNDKKVPRRISIGDGDQDHWAGIDFWSYTYTETFNSASVFKVPAYCKKKCNNG